MNVKLSNPPTEDKSREIKRKKILQGIRQIVGFHPMQVPPRESKEKPKEHQKSEPL